MKKDLTELVCILDRSGSMSGLENDTIGGYNSMMTKQKAVDGECRITTVLFDHHYDLLHDRIDIQAVNEITDKEYTIGGSTALLDAIGKSIQKIINVQRQTAEPFCAEKVIFVIITDGEENSSHEYTAEKIKEKIAYQKEKYGWEFIFLGANIDAVSTAKHIGINADRAQDFHPDSQGIGANFSAINHVLETFRKYSDIPQDWNQEIEKDFKGRSKTGR